MIGLGATTLIAHEVKEHPLHRTVRNGIRRCVANGDRFGLSDQTLWEFLHIVTDARRFSRPMEMPVALERARRWSYVREVTHLETTRESTEWTLKWMEEFRLGRKRILDTALAATFHVHGVRRVASANVADFRVFGVFDFEAWAQG